MKHIVEVSEIELEKLKNVFIYLDLIIIIRYQILCLYILQVIKVVASAKETNFCAKIRNVFPKVGNAMG